MASLKSGRQLVFTVGEPVRLSDVSMQVKDVDITALGTNTGNVFIGDVDVGAAAGSEAGFSPLSAGDALTFEDVDLHEIWLDATVAENGVHWGAVIE